MNEITVSRKDNRMSVEEAVAKGAEIFEGAEQRAHWIKKNFRDLREVFEAVRDGGHLGGLETQAMATEADALATQFEADVYSMHALLTERAKELGIDLPQRSGGR
jgi:hypothetical protein